VIEVIVSKLKKKKEIKNGSLNFSVEDFRKLGRSDLLPKDSVSLFINFSQDHLLHCGTYHFNPWDPISADRSSCSINRYNESVKQKSVVVYLTLLCFAIRLEHDHIWFPDSVRAWRG